ncbi:DUF192 domain-containing protein [Virgibacillus sp. W0430]|uniref:DUF192 domain-containing protein n=1 Tax=Virgibacillus sp. W0430 TaxID=3391580 RepID=UPI003F479A9F
MKAHDVKAILNIIYADSAWKRMKGLMFYKQPISKIGLYIVPCNSIHMFFMRFPIDVVFTDRSNRVVKVVRALKPWKVIFPVKDAYAVLELPTGTIAKEGIRKGDYIVI